MKTFDVFDADGAVWLEALAPTPELSAEVVSIPGAEWKDGVVTGSESAIRGVLHAVGQLWPYNDAPSRLGPTPATWSALMPAQQRGARWLFDRPNAIHGGDVGTGKTVQTIAAAVEVLRRRGPGQPRLRWVVLCPPFLRAQWEAEIKRWVSVFAPTVEEASRFGTVHVVHPRSAPKRLRDRAGPVSATWIVAGYWDVARVHELLGRSLYSLVVDEVHNMRNLDTQRSTAVQGMSTFALQTWGLTASLLYNQGTKLHPVLTTILGTGWGSWLAFARRYTDIAEGEFGLEGGRLLLPEREAELRARLAGEYLRMTKADLGPLPFAVRFQVMRHVGVRPPGDTFAATALARLASLKVAPVAECVRTDLAAGRSCLVVTYLRSHAEALAAELKGAPVLLSLGGDTNRLATIQAHAAQHQPCVVVSTIDGISEGANLQWCKSVHFAALDWIAEKIRQVVGRAARLGQTGDVSVTFHVVPQTVDEVIVSRVLEQLQNQKAVDGTAEADKTAISEALQKRDIQRELDALLAAWKNTGEVEQ